MHQYADDIQLYYSVRENNPIAGREIYLHSSKTVEIVFFVPPDASIYSDGYIPDFLRQFALLLGISYFLMFMAYKMYNFSSPITT